MWAQASRWPGPDDQPGYREAITQAMVSEGPAAIRRRVRDWLDRLLQAEGACVTLGDPTSWEEWNEEYRQ